MSIPTETCPHGNVAPIKVLEDLPDPSDHGQGRPARWACTVCAYEMGFQDGLDNRPILSPHECKGGSVAPSATLKALPTDQGGAGRHKCAICAYQAGFDAGQFELIERFDREQNRLNDVRLDDQAQNSLETELVTHGESLDNYFPQPEGLEITRQHITYERSPQNRAAALKIHGSKCAACGFDFDLVYGSDFARGYIEIHHVVSITQQAGAPVNPQTGLVPLCSNCHSMAHRERGKILSIQEIKALMDKQKP